MESDWKKKQIWTKRLDTFAVEIHHWNADLDPKYNYNNEDGGHRWNVYAYIYPTHWHFKEFKSNLTMFQEAALVLPIHGHSMLEYHKKKDGEIMSVQVGGDYNHLHDQGYTFMDESQFYVIERDANELIEWLNKSKSIG